MQTLSSSEFSGGRAAEVLVMRIRVRAGVRRKAKVVGEVVELRGVAGDLVTLWKEIVLHLEEGIQWATR